MKLALFGISFGACADPDVALRVALAAEQAGVESLWTGEHVVLPDPHQPPSPLPPETPLLDPVVALSYIAAHTRTIRLGTGIIILPQRNPLVLAKELATLDVVSRGRLMVGVGAGYLHQEFAALGIPFEDKGARMVEYMEAMQALWTQPKPEYRGRFVSFGNVQAFPRPVQKPHPPFVMGGATPPAFRRAVTMCQGWFGFAMDLDKTASAIQGLRAEEARHDRPAELGELEISIAPGMPLDADTVRRYEDLGVHRLIVARFGASAEDMMRMVDDIAALMR